MYKAIKKRKEKGGEKEGKDEEEEKKNPCREFKRNRTPFFPYEEST